MISRTVLRFIARKCLEGATLAGGRVFDSAIDPLDRRMTADPAPAIVIYTDDQISQFGNSITPTPGAGSIDFVIEVVVASAVTLDAETVIEIAATDDGFELTLDLIEHEIERCLFGGGAWPDLFQTVVIMRSEKTSRRGAPEGGAARWAARQIVMKLQILQDPPPGKDAPETGGWADVLDAFDADPDLARYAPIFRSYLFSGGGGAAHTDLGLPKTEADAMGTGPAADGDSGAPILEEIELDDRS